MLKLCLFFITISLYTMVFAENFVVGKDYELLHQEVTTPNNKTHIIEFFSYGCSACYQIESSLEEFVTKNNNEIIFSRVPVVFHDDWIVYAKAYYIAQILGLEPILTPALFKAIQDTKLVLNQEQLMIDFFKAHHITSELAKSAFENSTMVDMKISEGSKLMAQEHINSVPTIVINNKYKISLQMAQNKERLFKIINFLLSM